MTNPSEAERARVLAEYARRAREIPADRYAAWQPAEALARASRLRVATELLSRVGAFPQLGDRCLEIGCGSLGWLGQLVSWGVSERDLAGIELDPERIAKARQILPGADLRLGDATRLPWADQSFKLVILSTVLTSVLDRTVRREIAVEATRVLASDGALLWYDFAYDNPLNPNVRGISAREVRALFPELTGPLRSVTLAPPLARLVAPFSWTLATLLESMPLLRTHLLAVLRHRASARG